MPPEWARHERTWMEFPPANDTFGDDPDGELGRYRRAWAAVVNAIARFEPVSLICNIGDGAAARALVDPSVTIHETAIDESWFRDSGPTFVTHPDGRLGAVHWRFNGWGQQDFCEWDDEQHVGAFAARLAGAELFTSTDGQRRRWHPRRRRRHGDGHSHGAARSRSATRAGTPTRSRPS